MVTSRQNLPERLKASAKLISQKCLKIFIELNSKVKLMIAAGVVFKPELHFELNYNPHQPLYH